MKIDVLMLGAQQLLLRGELNVNGDPAGRRKLGYTIEVIDT